MDVQMVREKALSTQTQRYTAKDTILYALSVGFSADPLAADELRYTYEEDLRALPTMACVLAHPGFWFRDPSYGIDWVRILHGGQRIDMLRPLPPSGEVRAAYEVIGVDDKGEGRGAVMQQEKRLYEAGSGELIARVRSTVLLRGDGGCGGFGEKPGPAVVMPEGEPERRDDLFTMPNAALLYRLNGDANPIHADPAAAAAAGFPRPILHGLCTMGIACRGLVQTFCGGDASRLQDMSVRFTKPVFPGETLRLETWRRDGRILFRMRVVERDVIAMDSCEAGIAEA